MNRAEVMAKLFKKPKRPAARKTYRSEAEIQAGIMGYLNTMKIFAWRNNTGGFSPRPGQFLRFGEPGSADILGVLPGGRFFAIECKRVGKRATPLQAEWLAQVNENGGLGFVASSADDVRAQFRAAGYPSE